jgi:capsular exopolysaccharide synthesis family protein
LSRYYPSMKKYSWIIAACLVIGLIGGFVLSKVQPAAYVVNSTLLVYSAPNFGTGTNTQGTGGPSTDTLSQSVNDAAEIPTRSVMNFVFQSTPALQARGFTADDLLVDVTAMNPSATTSSVLLTATARKPADAVLLVNSVANGYVAYKTKQAQDQLDSARTNYQNLYNQYKTQSQDLEKQILSYSNSSDPHIALLTEDRTAVITSMNAVQSQLLQLPSTAKGDVEVVQPAKLSDATPSTKSTVIMAVTAGLGLVVGLLIWLFVVFMDRRVRSEDQVPEKLGLSYLGSLSKNSEIQPGSVPTTGLAAQQLADIGINLRLTGVLPGSWRAPQGAVLLVTSAQSVEGKTTVASGLAAAASRGGRSVLVIDGNLRQPTTHLAFGTAPASFGLSGLLKATGTENLDAAIQRTNIPGVWLLAGGSVMDDSTLLLEQRMPGILAQLRKKTDWIIIDGPSLLTGAEASLLASMSDGVAMVVDARHDKIALLLRAKAVLRSLTHTPIGVILNKLSPSKRNPYYAMAYAEDSANEGIPSGQKYSSNGHDVGPEQVANVPGPSIPNQFSASSMSGRPMPMDLPLMQPNLNPPSPFPSPRRMDMTPPQS